MPPSAHVLASQIATELKVVTRRTSHDGKMPNVSKFGERERFPQGSGQPAPTALDQTLLTMTEEAIGGPGTPVALKCLWSDPYDGWEIAVRPGNRSSCGFTLCYDRDETIHVTLGAHTYFEYWLDERREDRLAPLAKMLKALVAGRVVEAGIGDGFARLWNQDGTVVGIVGRAHLPWPWFARPFKRKYQAY